MAEYHGIFISILGSISDLAITLLENDWTGPWTFRTYYRFEDIENYDKL